MPATRSVFSTILRAGHLETSFQLPGTITRHAQVVQVELRPFNDHALNRDLVVLCERVNEASPRLLDEHLLTFTVRPSCCILAAQTKAKIP
jgi:hypothetical protein